MNNPFDTTPQYLIASCVALLLLWHVSSSAHQESPSPPTVQGAAQSSTLEPLVLTVTVADKKGDPISGLPQSAFTVFDNKVSRDIIAFNNGDVPLSIGIVLDFSSSTEEYRNLLRVISGSLQSFIQSSNSSNDYFIVGFKETPELLQDWTSNQEALRLVLEQIPQNKLKGKTALYDAIDYSVEKLEHGRHAKRALVLVSDGVENGSETSPDKLYQHLKSSTVLIYALDMSSVIMHKFPSAVDASNSGSSGSIYASSVTLAARHTLEEVTSLSGGRMFSKPQPVEIRKAIERIALELRSQYSLSIKPVSGVGTDRWHTLKVRVKASSTPQVEQKSISVRSREGYYAGDNPR
jgi:Ca-activated chloride channel homolog